MKKTLGMLAALAVLVITSTSTWAIGTGSVEPSGGAWYPAGTNLTVTATPGTNDMLKGWTGDTNSATFGASTISFVVDAPRTIQAVFADIMHQIIASAGPNGSISNVGTNNVAQGDSLAFTITPSANYHIADVVVDSSSVGPTNSYTLINVTNAHTIAASFAIDTYTVDFLAGLHGSLSGASNSQTIAHGSDATAPTINPNAGYVDNGWNDSYTGITSDRTLTAQYTTNEYTLTFVSAGSAVAPIAQLYTTSIVAPPNPTRTGYTFTGWDPSLPTEMPLGGGTYTAQWSANPFQLIIISEHGSPNPSGTNNYDFGTSVDFAIAGTPEIIPSNSMFEVTGWVRAGSDPTSGVTTNDSFTITNNTTITWQWGTNYWIELNTTGE